MTTRQAAIYGLSGPALTPDEITAIRRARPLGFILFARNIVSLRQVSDLTGHLKSLLDNAPTLVLVDQEGGRVARLRPPLAREYPPARLYGRLYAEKREDGMRAAYLGAFLAGRELAPLGINVNCAPCLDLGLPQTSDVIGDRAFADKPDVVGALGLAVGQGLRDAGVLPVIKHMPGHGRGAVDSHEALPLVEEASDVLVSDFAPFRQCRSLPLAMTGHLVFNAIDPHHVSTQSKILIESIIRGHIGFDGLLMTDDISMKALSPSIDIKDHAQKALDAGCDVVLHCNGEPEEMFALVETLPDLAGKPLERVERVLSLLEGEGSGASVDTSAALNEWQELLKGVFPNL